MMSEPKDSNTQSNPSDQQQASDQSALNLFEELSKLGLSMEKAARSTLNNEHARAMQRDVMESVQTFMDQVQSATKNFQDDPRVKDMTERGQQAVNQAQERAQQVPMVNELEQVMARSISFFSAQFNDFAERMQSQSSGQTETTGGTTGAQNVPVEDDSQAATGPTVRLDPDKEK